MISTRTEILRLSDPRLFKNSNYCQKVQRRAQPMVLLTEPCSLDQIKGLAVRYRGQWYGSDNPDRPYVGFIEINIKDGTKGYAPAVFAKPGVRLNKALGG